MATAEALGVRPEAELDRDDSVAESAAAARAEDPRITASSFEWLAMALSGSTGSSFQRELLAEALLEHSCWNEAP
jgi:hypothetical protein